MKNHMLYSTLLTALPVAGMTAGAPAPEKKTGRDDVKPNLLFIMTDQQRFDALGAAGVYPFLQTPNLDRLAATGAYFQRAYTQCAVSAPVRATLFTGLTVYNHKLFTNELVNKDPESFGFTHNKTFDQVLADNGYYIEHHGKLHVPTQLADGYANYTRRTVKFGSEVPAIDTPMKAYVEYIRAQYGEIPFGEGDMWDNSFDQPYAPDPIDRRYGKPTNYELTAAEKKQRVHAQPDEHGMLHIKPEDSYTAFQTRQAMEALHRAKQSGKPFSVTCSYHFPHAPMLAPKPWYGMYPVDSMPVPASIADDMKQSPYIAANGRLVLPQYSDPDKIRYMMSTYFGLVSEIDHWVGELLGTLDELGYTGNTMVVFLSDHGEMLGSHGMREKNVFFEESARVPLIVSFPGRIEPVKVGGYCSTIDMYATILDYMGVKDTQKTDSRSLRGMIEGTDEKRGGSVVTEWLYRGPTQPNYMIVMDNWKLYVPYASDSKVRNVLHDLSADPSEMVNLLAGDDRGKYAAKAEQLRGELVKWLREHNPDHADGVAQRAL